MTFLCASWKYGLLFCFFAALIFLFPLNSIALFFGWLSAVHILHHARYKVSHHHHHDLTVIVHFAEILFFILITSSIALHDDNVLVWLLQIVAHALYLFVVFSLNAVSGRLRSNSKKTNYHMVYGIVLFVSDFTFMLLAFIVGNTTLIFTALLATVTFAALWYRKQ